MESFQCEKCRQIFEAEPQKKEWTDRIYGPQWKFYAISPCCNEESYIYRKPSQKKSKSSAPPLPSCNSGGCSHCPMM